MQFDGIKLTSTPLHGNRVQGWLDGSTQARATWESGPPAGYDAPEATWKPHTRVVQSDLEVMQLLVDIDLFENARLISAVLEEFQAVPGDLPPGR